MPEDDKPHTGDKETHEKEKKGKKIPYDPDKDKPPVEDIPKALEFKLDVIIRHLRRMTGHDGPPNVGPFPDPGKFNPENDPFPGFRDIPASLEWKLDVQLVQLEKIKQAITFIAILLFGAFLAVVFLLLGIWNAINGLAGIIPLLLAIAALVAAIAWLMAFLVIRFVLPLMRKLGL